MDCHEFREMMDSYLSDELLVETNHEVLRHLENCPACRNELAARRGLLTQMRAAVRSAAEARLNPAFSVKLKNDLRQIALRPTFWEKFKSSSFADPKLLTVTAASFLLLLLFGTIWFNRLSPTGNTALARQNETNNAVEISRPTESPVNQVVQIARREMMQLAVGDHKNCALHFRLAENPITLDEAAEKYGKFNKDLDKAVIASLGKVSAEKVSGKTLGKMEFLESHSCVYNGRRFAHVVLQNGKKIISILVTDAEDLPDENDDKIINQPDENFQIAQFRAARHAVFVVSDLSEQENLRIAETLSPVVRRHIGQA